MIEQRRAGAPLISAEALKDRITHTLSHSWLFDPDGITVVVSGSKVRLAGAVRSQRELKMAAAVAVVTQGVTVVENDLIVV
jgi:osmotically-inducible protein OsmY